MIQNVESMSWIWQLVCKGLIQDWFGEQNQPINSFPTKHGMFRYSWDNASFPNIEFSVFSQLYATGCYYASPEWV